MLHTRLAFALAAVLVASCQQPSTPVVPQAANGLLEPPPAGQGVQLTVGPFEVPSLTEVQKNFYLKLPTEQDVAVNRIEIAYPTGSHHCNVFKSDTEDVPDHVEDTFDAVAYQKYDMFAASQNGTMNWKLPEGVAIKLKKRQQLIVQTHWVNGITQQTPGGQGQVRINLWFARPEEVKTTLGMLFAINQNLAIPPGETTEASKVIDLARLGIKHDVKIVGMTGHFHSRGKAFEINRWDGQNPGEQLYKSENWADPPFKTYEPGLDLRVGEKLRYTSTFVNNTNITIRFGPKVDTQEHSNLFMYFYPGPEDGKALYDLTGAEGKPLN